MKIKKIKKLFSILTVFGLSILLSISSPLEAQATAQATGGTYTESGGYGIHTFTSSGTFTPDSAMNVEVLVIAGGGGGGGRHGGGGGAGGYTYDSSTAVTAQGYTITIGSGGSAGIAADASGNNGGDGNNSSALGFTTTGGGGGAGGWGGGSSYPSKSGGSGGGGAGSGSGASGTVDQGNSGGNGYATPWNGGGGGGASTSGTNASSSNIGGNGGSGTANSITGTSVTRAGGGAGGSYDGTQGTAGSGGGGSASSSGTAGSGGGGGGGANANAGGAGGSGVVIIRYILESSCSPSLGDSTHEITTDCSFTGYTDALDGAKIVSGLDSGTSTTNTSVLTVTSGILTVNANETLVFGSLEITTGGSVAIAEGSTTLIGGSLWAIDGDDDDYPETTTFYAQTTTPTDGVRLNSISSNIATVDCDDGTNSGTNTCTSCAPGDTPATVGSDIYGTTCQKCVDGYAVVQTSSQDLFSQCSSNTCDTGNCNGTTAACHDGGTWGCSTCASCSVPTCTCGTWHCADTSNCECYLTGCWDGGGDGVGSRCGAAPNYVSCNCSCR